MADSPESITPTSVTPGDVSPSPPTKMKNRHKILSGLQRMASTPSLAKVGRSRSTSLGSRKFGKGTMSCVSLNSYGQCFGNSNTSHIPANLHARPMTAAGKDDHDDNDTPVRVVEAEHCGLNGNGHTSIPLPADMRPSSRGLPLESTAEAPEIPKVTESVQYEVDDASQDRKFDFWQDMPVEIRMQILQHLPPKEVVKCSRVSKSWHEVCFDGQLWASLDASTFYRDIPMEALVKIMTTAGPFLRDLSLRGCIQLKDAWVSDGERISDSCRNLVNLCIQDCRINKTSLHLLVVRNPSLVHIDISGLTTASNHTMKLVGQSCPNLEFLNISWCKSIDAKGLKWIASCCRSLKDLRASELRGFDDEDMMLELFQANSLETLILSHSSSLNDESFKTLLHGLDPEIDCLTDRALVPPRTLKHLDVSRCRNLSSIGIQYLSHNVPDLECLQVSHCFHFSDEALLNVINTTPRLTHLDLEELEDLTNNILVGISNAPCAEVLENLNVGYCEKLGDTGFLQLLKKCNRLKSLDLDNTRVSDLTIMEICSQVRKRGFGNEVPHPGLRLAIFDCGNVTWAGVREVLSSNTFVPRTAGALPPKDPKLSITSPVHSESSSGTATPATPTPPTQSTVPVAAATYPNEIIQMKCFYGWQMTVDEHTKRVLRGNLPAAMRLERKWADYMMANEEAETGGNTTSRSRRRRAREIEQFYNTDDYDDDDDDIDVYGPAGLAPLGGRRRRARSGGCVIM